VPGVTERPGTGAATAERCFQGETPSHKKAMPGNPVRARVSSTCLHYWRSTAGAKTPIRGPARIFSMPGTHGGNHDTSCFCPVAHHSLKDAGLRH
jgi:hypothetical protein